MPGADHNAALADLEVLVLDCQTTGAKPDKGHLLELAWCVTRASDADPKVRTFLLKSPDGTKIPPRISKLTGIDAEQMEQAVDARSAWEALNVDAKRIDEIDAVPCVAHFARFEALFLRDLHRMHAASTPFPLDFICTHEIACRALPELPRRGLRPLAGYLGFLTGETKRATSHVLATLAVWRALVGQLARDYQVETLADLRHFIRSVPAQRRGGREFPLTRKKRLELPDAPGIYRMLGKGGEVLYLGKATSLKRRVNSYFQKRRHGQERTPELLTQTWNIDVTVTASALEAALAESDGIKKHAPPYNVALRARDRQAWFASPCFTSARCRADPKHAIGPLPNRQVIDALAELSALIREPRKNVSAERHRALGLMDDAQIGALSEAVIALKKKYAIGERPLSLVRLLRLGARRWRQIRIVTARERETETASAEAAIALLKASVKRAPEASDEAEAQDPVETTLERLEMVICRGAHLLRRARWLCELTDCAITFSSADERRFLLFGAAALQNSGALEGDNPPPLPSSYRRSLTTRQRLFNATVYDRLRVLTTELRALVAEGGDVEIRFAPDRRLGRQALVRRLHWV